MIASANSDCSVDSLVSISNSPMPKMPFMGVPVEYEFKSMWR